MINIEVNKMAFSLVPLFILGFAVMVALVQGAVIGTAYYWGFAVNWTLFPLGLVVVICPCLASACGLGVFALFGFRMNGLMFITPFLVLGIGVDDAFLILQAWYR